MLKITVTIILMFTLYSCNENAAFNNVINKVYNNADLQNTDFIVIIPSAGCSGCILGVEDFYLNNKELSNIKYIFFNIISTKELKMKGINSSYNTVLDTANIVMDAYPQNNKIYPCILELKKGKVINTYYQSPESNALDIIINRK